MRKYHEVLMSAMKELESKKMGNHSVVVSGSLACFTYFGNTVVTVDTLHKTYTVDWCGYEDFSSTRDCINGYICLLYKLKYKRIFEEPKLVATIHIRGHLFRINYDAKDGELFAVCDNMVVGEKSSPSKIMEKRPKLLEDVEDWLRLIREVGNCEVVA